jgi:MATE family multidrug resistance protein
MQESSRWSHPAGYRKVLLIAIPLVISTSSQTLQMFVDRLFLIWYSPEAIAAAMPAGMVQFTMVSFFIGMAGYANAFVAQYHGAGRDDRIGPALWQSIYFALFAGVLLPCFAPLSIAIFRAAGHAPAVRDMEADYFRILMLGSFFPIYNAAISCFYTGLGRNWPVLWVNVLITAVNVVFDYLWIFGNWGFPELGISGAAWATNLGNAAGSMAYTFLVLQPEHRWRYHTLSGWRPNLMLLRRLVRFGLPAGIQFSVDMLGVTFFVILVGRIGTAELSATNVAFQVNMLAFMPMIGFGIATTTLVGQWLGRGKPDCAARATWSALHMTIAYMSAIALAYVLIP